MDLIHKTCKNKFTILWFQVNSLGVSLNWTAPSFINHIHVRSYSLLLREYCGSMVNLKLPSNTTRLAGAVSSGCSLLKHYRYENTTTWLDNHRSMSTRRLQRYHCHVSKNVPDIHINKQYWKTPITSISSRIRDKDTPTSFSISPKSAFRWKKYLITILLFISKYKSLRSNAKCLPVQLHKHQYGCLPIFQTCPMSGCLPHSNLFIYK